MEKAINKAINAGIEKTNKKSFVITPKMVSAVILTVLSFFIGRIALFQGINPFAIAFLAVFLYTDKIFYSAALFSVPGFLLSSGGIYTSKYV